MNYGQALQALKDRLQVDPTRGSAWVETDDIEQALYWAGRIGKGHLPGLVVTYDGSSFAIRKG